MILDTGLSGAVGQGISQGLSLVSLLDARKERDRRAELAQEQLAQRAAIAQMQQDARERGLDIREYLGELQSQDRNRGLDLREDQFNQKQTAMQSQADAMAELLGAGGGIGSLQMLGTPPEQPGGEWRAPMAMPQGTAGGGMAGGLGIDPRLMRNLPPNLQAEIIKRGFENQFKAESERATIDRNLQELARVNLPPKLQAAAIASVTSGASPEYWLRKAAETEALDDYEQGIQNAAKPMPEGAVGPPEPLFSPEQRTRAVQMARLTGKPLAGGEARRVLGGDEEMTDDEAYAAAIELKLQGKEGTIEELMAFARSRKRGLVNQKGAGAEGGRAVPLSQDRVYQAMKLELDQAEREAKQAELLFDKRPTAANEGAVVAAGQKVATVNAKLQKYALGEQGQRLAPDSASGVLGPDGGLSSDRIVQRYAGQPTAASTPNPASGAGLQNQQAPASGPQLTPKAMPVPPGYAQAAKEFAEEWGRDVPGIAQMTPEDQAQAKAWLRRRILELNAKP